jgi:heptosyltransferase-2
MARALVIAPQWIGDAVMSEPLLALLSARGDRLAVAALPWVAPVYRAMPQVGEVIELPFAHGRLDWSGRRRVARTLRGRFDAAYVLPNSIKSALVPFFARIPRRIGYRGEGRIGLLNERLPNPPAGHRWSRSTPRSAGAGAAPTRPPRLVVGDAAIAAATTQADVAPGGYVVFAPGAEYGPAKCWPASHYAELARSLDAARRGPVLLLGSGKERALAMEIAAAAPGACRVMAGATTLDEAIALIAGSRGMVSNDSGLMHVAAAFGVPQVAVFGSTSPEHTPPLNRHAKVLWLKDELGLDCMPCFERTCRYGHYRCLTEVSAARVEQAYDEALAS